MVPSKFRASAVILFLLAILFFLFFDISKQNEQFGPVNPFGEDPYDAISTFALQASLFFSLLAGFRAFRPYHGGQPSSDQVIFLVRAEIAASLTLLTALASDLAALARYPSLWSGSSGGIKLGFITVGFFLAVAAISLYFWLTAWRSILAGSLGSWLLPAVVTVVFLAVLLLFPSELRQSTPGALVTVLVGASLLFGMVRAWAGGLSTEHPLTGKRRLPTWLWELAIGIGTLLGGAIVLRELWVNDAIDLNGKGSVIAVFVGLEIAGMLIGLAFLGNFLGLGEIFTRKSQ